ncbi:hypothetical protein [Latilactobacillus phage TMW 1.46 P2]|nr:hypothetical protein A4W82_06305 [Latilactobacillus sakei]WAX23978.1 hypothetical protein [Latilactobacillus phage TMW 1.46 P2]
MHYLKLGISWILLTGMMSDVVFIIDYIVYFKMNSLLQILLSISLALFFFKIRDAGNNSSENWFFGTTIKFRFIIHHH